MSCMYAWSALEALLAWVHVAKKIKNKNIKKKTIAFHWAAEVSKTTRSILLVTLGRCASLAVA